MNRDVNFRPAVEPLGERTLPAINVTGGVVELVGATTDDRVDVTVPAAGQVRITCDATKDDRTFAQSDVTSLLIRVRAGNDVVLVDRTLTLPVEVRGWAGDDTIFGGAGSDVLLGGGGTDVVNGRAGNDTLIGQAGNDFLYGGDGDDTLFGDLTGGTVAGDDKIDGGTGTNAVMNPLGNDEVKLNTGGTAAGGTGSQPGFQFTLVNSGGLTDAQFAVVQQAAGRWSQVITGDLPDVVVDGVAIDDIRVTVSAKAIDGPGGTLAQAGPDSFRDNGGLPTTGSVEVDTADLPAAGADTLDLRQTLIHEFAHVLGIGTLWETRGLVAGAGGADPQLRGANAIEAYNKFTGTQYAGVPLDNSGGEGTREAHWRDTALPDELMVGASAPGVLTPLSLVTIGALADLGYQVDARQAEAFGSLPAGAAGTSIGSGTSQPVFLNPTTGQPVTNRPDLPFWIDTRNPSQYGGTLLGKSPFPGDLF